MIQFLRTTRFGGARFSRVLVGGHSLGSGTAILEAATFGGADAVMITGLTHRFNALNLVRHVRGAGASYIEPGSPWQNPYVESFNARVRDEVLDVELFSSLTEARLILADWLASYNAHHPHSSLGMRSPASFAATWRPGPELAEAA